MHRANTNISLLETIPAHAQSKMQCPHLVGGVRMVTDGAAMMQLSSGCEGVAADLAIPGCRHQDSVIIVGHELGL